MNTFDEMAASRRQWIDEVLIPWCRQARRAELIKAEAEWPNVAGQVDPQSTLWSWAWGRFPALVHDGLAGVNETCEVEVRLHDGRAIVGFPDNEETGLGMLTLMLADGKAESFSIDDIADVRET